MKAALLEAYQADEQELHPPDEGDAQDGDPARRGRLGRQLHERPRQGGAPDALGKTRRGRRDGRSSVRRSRSRRLRPGAALGLDPRAMERRSRPRRAARAPSVATISRDAGRARPSRRGSRRPRAVHARPRSPCTMSMSSGVMSPGWTTPTASETFSRSRRRVTHVVGDPDRLQVRVEAAAGAGRSGSRRPSGTCRCGTSAPGCSRCENIASRATLTMSTPSANATTAFSGRPSLPAPMKVTSSWRPGLGEPPVDLGEAEPEREGHRVGEDQRRRSGAALAAVDVDEVDPATTRRHLRRPGGPRTPCCRPRT